MGDSESIDINVLRTPIKDEIFEEDSINSKLKGKIIEHQFSIQPKIELPEIKRESEEEFVGEAVEFSDDDIDSIHKWKKKRVRQKPGKWRNKLNSSAEKIYSCKQCKVKSCYKNHDLHADFIRITTKELNFTNPYKCITCNLQFSNTEVALFHLSLHDKESFRCHKCDYTAKIFSDFIQHIEKSHTEDENVFRCFRCNFVTTWPHEYSYHRRHFHKPQSVYKCQLCDENWPDDNHSLHEKMIHIRNKYATKSYVCKECNISLACTEDIYDHLRIHGDIGIFCSFCSFTSDSLEDLENHKKGNHLEEIKKQTILQQKIRNNPTNDKDVKCYKCNRFWPDNNHLTHEEMLPIEKYISEDNPYKCTECHKVSHDLREVYNHVNGYCTKLKCPYCPKRFTMEVYVKQHILKKHEGVEIDCEVITCKLCDFKTVIPDNAKKHAETHKKREEREQYNCNQCSFITLNAGYLKQHRLWKHPLESDTLYTCDHCSFSSYILSIIKRHARVHSNELFKCEICNSLFRSSLHLQGHVKRKHFSKTEKKTTYVCEICAKVYCNKLGLTTHMHRVHQVAVEGREMKVYICYVCNYKSSKRPNFVMHTKLHLEHSEVFYCANCEYKTKRKINLIQHMVKHTDSSKMELHKCKICSFTTKRPHILRNHIKYTHKAC